jgi:hypothetical protein
MRPANAHIEQQLTDFITANALSPGDALGRREPLLAEGMAEGILDSLGILHLVAFIEDEYAISVPDASWIPEHFQDVQHLAALVVHLGGAQSPAADALT